MNFYFIFFKLELERKLEKKKTDIFNIDKEIETIKKQIWEAIFFSKDEKLKKFWTQCKKNFLHVKREDCTKKKGPNATI